MFTLCTTVAQVFCSLDALIQAAFLILDCEGRDLGCQAGALSLLTIGTHNYSEVFVYDVVHLGHAGLLPVLRLLARPDILKVVWDGRMDFNELYFAHGVTLEHVLDLQIVEVASRATRGENENRRLARLKRYFRPTAIRKDEAEYVGLQTVIGMQQCLQEHALAVGIGKDVDVMKLHSVNQTDLWMSRPLPDEPVAYAAHDIYLIHLICDHFHGQGYLNPLPTFLAQSRRYVAIHSDVGSRPLRGDCFRSSPVLPLDILQEPASETYACIACDRKLSLHCFTARFGCQQRSTICRVCFVVGKRNGRIEEVNWVQIT